MNTLRNRVKEILGDLTSTYWGRKIMAAAIMKEFIDSGKVADKFATPFTSKDREEAGHWPTCACGDMYARKPFERLRDTKDFEYNEKILEHGVKSFAESPTDEILEKLGSIFSDYVIFGDVINAAKTLVAIEDRGAELQQKGKS